MNIQPCTESESIDIETMLIGNWGKIGTQKWLMLGHGINRSTQSVRTKVFYLYGKKEARAVLDQDKNIIAIGSICEEPRTEPHYGKKIK